LRSDALFLLGESERGLADLNRALSLDPSLRQGWLNKAALAMAARQYDEALSALRQAQKLDPAAADNEINLGAALLLKGDLTEAARSFQRYLDLHRSSAESHYLVATNYVLAGYAAPAVDLLRRAIQLDERSRLRARTDPNFAAMISEPAYRQLLAQEPQRPARGSHVSRFLFARPYQEGKAELLPAVLDTLQTARVAFDRQVEATPGWALIWGEIRVEVRDSPDGRGLVQFSAPGNAMSAAAWEARTQDLVRRIQSRLVTLMAARRKAQVQRRSRPN
jgi:tetratricopeptide (TPR) repeat protein